MTKFTRRLLQILQPDYSRMRHTDSMMIGQGKPLKQIIKELAVPQPVTTEPETWREYIRYS